MIDESFYSFSWTSPWMMAASYSETLGSVYQSIQHCVTQHGKLVNNYLTVQEIPMHFRHNVSS
jgi:membrane-bound lytic murein transglycosylase